VDRRRRVTGRAARFDFDDVVYGIHAVAEALAAGDSLRTIYVAADRKRDAPLRDLLARAEELRVPVRFERRTFFADLPMRAHQGVVALAPPFSYASLGDVLNAPPRAAKRLYVLVDHLTDPHNIGAIVRTADAAGVDAVILPERRSGGINATVRKAAAGATAHVPIARVTNLADAVRTLKKSGIWVVGADSDAGATEMARADFDRNLALTIGAEGSGLSPLVRRECDYLVRIPMYGAVASLNASVAAGVLLYEALRQRLPHGDS